MEELRQHITNQRVTCDIIISEDALLRFSSIATELTGKFRKALLITPEDMAPGAVALVEKTIIGAGYHLASKNAPKTHTEKDLTYVLGVMSEAELTKDGLLVAFGPNGCLELCAYAAALWCESIPYIAIPTELASVVSLPTHLTPLSCSGRACVTPPFRVDALLCQKDLLEPTRDVAMAVTAIQAAVVDGQDALLEVARLQMAKNPYELALLAARWAGRADAAANITVRTGLSYGYEFARALHSLAPDTPFELALAEGMRFSARLSVSLLDTNIDFVCLQDRLLEEAGAHLITAPARAAAIEKAFLAELALYTQRMLVALPYAPGRVRLVPVPKELLEEHIEAWTESRK